MHKSVMNFAIVTFIVLSTVSAAKAQGPTSPEVMAWVRLDGKPSGSMIGSSQKEQQNLINAVKGCNPGGMLKGTAIQICMKEKGYKLDYIKRDQYNKLSYQ